MTPEQVAIYFPIGHTSHDASRRGVKYLIEKKGGWKKFIKAEVQPALDLGVKTIQIHNPAGVGISDKFMRFDQFSLAKSEGLDFENDFVKAFSRLTNRGIRVIGYIGSPDDIPQLWDAGGDIDRDWLLDDDDAQIKHNPFSMQDLRTPILDEFKHFRDSGVDLGMDRSTEKGPDSISWWLCHKETQEGRRPVLELLAPIDRPWFWNYDQLILYRSLVPRCIEQEKAVYINRYPELGTSDRWYPKKTFVLFRSTVNFTQGQRKGQSVSLWRDATPLVEWWNHLRSLNSKNDIVLMTTAKVLQKLIDQDLLKELAD